MTSGVSSSPSRIIFLVGVGVQTTMMSLAGSIIDAMRPSELSHSRRAACLAAVSLDSV